MYEIMNEKNVGKKPSPFYFLLATRQQPEKEEGIQEKPIEVNLIYKHLV